MRHLDVTRRARAGALSCRAVKAASEVHLVSTIFFGFLRSMTFVRSEYLPAGLHGAEGVPPLSSTWMPF